MTDRRYARCALALSAVLWLTVAWPLTLVAQIPNPLQASQQPEPARGGRKYAPRSVYDPNAQVAGDMGTLKEADAPGLARQGLAARIVEIVGRVDRGHSIVVEAAS